MARAPVPTSHVSAQVLLRTAKAVDAAAPDLDFEAALALTRIVLEWGGGPVNRRGKFAFAASPILSKLIHGDYLDTGLSPDGKAAVWASERGTAIVTGQAFQGEEEGA